METEKEIILINPRVKLGLMSQIFLFLTLTIQPVDLRFTQYRPGIEFKVFAGQLAGNQGHPAVHGHASWSWRQPY